MSVASASLLVSGNYGVASGAFDASVRVYDAFGGYISQGSGTIFASSLAGSTLKLSIATAAHVVEGGPGGTVSIGIRGNTDPAGFYVVPDSIVTASGGGAASGTFKGADLAYLGLTLNLDNYTPSQRAILTAIAPVPLSVAPPAPGFSFQAWGYGLGADTAANSTPVNPAYDFLYSPNRPDEQYGIEHTFSNTVTQYSTQVLDGYIYSDELYTLTSVDGNQGAGLPGDSGEGFIVGGFLQGLNNFGPNPGTACDASRNCIYVGYNYGGLYGGIRFTSEYRDWLQAESEALIGVPEPATWAMAAGAVLLLAGRLRLRPPRR